MSNDSLQNRDGFKSQWGFILACIGSAVGMGNIWRFPIMVARYGGLTFLLPYFLIVLLVGNSGVIEEFALGRRAKAGPIGAFGSATEARSGNRKLGELIGLIPIIGALMLAIGYTVVISWIFKYTFMSLSGGLYALGTDMGAIGGAFGGAAPEAGTLGEALAAIMFFVVLPREKALEEVNRGAKKPIFSWFHYLGYVFIAACIAALILGIKYGGIG